MSSQQQLYNSVQQKTNIKAIVVFKSTDQALNKNEYLSIEIGQKIGQFN